MFFKKLVSSLPFSPSLISQLGFYAQRLKKEQFMRRLGLIFTVFALIIQAFAVFSPPESANAASSNDLISGGCHQSTVSAMRNCFLSAYDNNVRGYGDLLRWFGITRDDIVNAQSGGTYTGKWSIRPNNYTYSFGHDNQNCRTASLTLGSNTFWYGKYRCGNYPGDYAAGLIGNGWALMADCGNLLISRAVPAVCPTNPAVPVGDPNCKPKCTVPGKTNLNQDDPNCFNPCPYNPNIPVGDPNCKAPSAKCTGLTASPTTGIAGQTQFTFHVSGSVDGGAAWTGYKVSYTSNGTTWQTGVSHALNADGSGGAYGNGAEWRNTFANAGKYQVRGYLNTTNAGNDLTSDACLQSVTVNPAPSASCKLLTVKQLSRTKFQLNASANVANGATVKGYKYTIKNAKGTAVYEKTFNSTKTTDSQEITLPDNSSLTDAAKYTATLTVLTSVGDKADATNCVKPLEISPKDKCEFNPDIASDDKNCKPKCEYDDNYFADDTEHCKPKCEYNNNIYADDKDCVPPCEYNNDILSTDPNCKAPGCEAPENQNKPECQPNFTITKSAKNNTQGGGDATAVKANGGDTIIYTIEVKNNGAVSGQIDIQDPLGDVLEYANLTDNGGGNLDGSNNNLSWSGVTVAPGQTVTRDFMITVKNPIPSVAQGQSEPGSYDCVMNNSMSDGAGGTIFLDIPVSCPTPKIVEQVVKQLPATGAGTNIIFGGIVAAVVVFFYARSRQLGKEVRLVRKEFNTGTL